LIAYGIFLYLFFQSTSIFMHRGLHAWPARVMFITSLVTLLLQGVYMVTFAIGLFATVKAALLGDPATIGASSRLVAWRNQMFPLIIVQNWVGQIQTYISDGIVLWRAWVLFSGQEWMMALPVALCLGSIGTGLGFLASSNNWPALVAIQDRQPVLALKLVTANIALSFATNVVATLLIAYRLWAHRKLVGVKAFRASSKSPVQNVLVILVESGIVYCAIQLVGTVLNLIPSSANVQSAQSYISLVINGLAISATAMYPIVVIMFVNQQRTIIECFGLDNTLKQLTNDNKYRAATPGHISFASPPTQATTHNTSVVLGLSQKSATEKGPGDIEKGPLVESESNSAQQMRTAPF